MGVSSGNDVTFGVYNRNRLLKELAGALDIEVSVIEMMRRNLRPIPPTFAQRIQQVFDAWDEFDTTPRGNSKHPAPDYGGPIIAPNHRITRVNGGNS